MKVAKQPKVRITPLDDQIRDHVIYALSVMDGDKMATARALGIGRSTLYRYIEKWRIHITKSVEREQALAETKV